MGRYLHGHDRGQLASPCGECTAILISQPQILLTLFAIFCTVAATEGLGQHFNALTLEQFSAAYQFELIGQTFGVGAVATSKLGVGLFQLRIVETPWVRWFIGFLVAVMTIGCAFEATIDFLQCIPPDHIWDSMVPARCWMSLAQYVSFSQFLGGTPLLLPHEGRDSNLVSVDYCV
jgi:hypothetical protein